MSLSFLGQRQTSKGAVLRCSLLEPETFSPHVGESVLNMTNPPTPASDKKETKGPARIHWNLVDEKKSFRGNVQKPMSW